MWARQVKHLLEDIKWDNIHGCKEGKHCEAFLDIFHNIILEHSTSLISKNIQLQKEEVKGGGGSVELQG